MDAENDKAGQSQDGMRPVQCACGVVLAVPVDVFVFQCSSCQQVMSLPKPLTEEERRRSARRALNRWMVRSAVSKELDLWLEGKETFTEGSNSLVARFYRKICEFPLFDDKSSGIDQALLDFFMFLPKLEDKLVKMGDKRSTVRTRFINYIAGPIFYSSFPDSTEESEDLLNMLLESRGEKNDLFKNELASLLRDLEKPDGASTILEAIESAHSIDEIPGAFGRMSRAYLDSSVANLEHSLAKPKSRSKIKSLYHLTPRRTILKLMSMNMGSGLASSAINLFMMKPFGRKSLMQRMASTTFGVNDAEDLANYAAKFISPEAKARCLAFIRETDGEEQSSIFFARDEEILHFLGSDELTAQWNCPPISEQELSALQRSCAEFKVEGGLNGLALQNSLENLSIGESSDEEDVDGEFDISEGGKVDTKPRSLDQSSKRKKSLFTRVGKALSGGSSSHQNEARHPLHYVRVFCVEESNRQTGELIVELLGDETLERFVRVSLPVIQKHIISSVSAKGSGLLPLLEGVFDAWRDILKVHKDKALSAMDKRTVYRQVVHKLHELSFTLVHNLVRGDKDKKWHQLVYWLVDLWASSKVDINTESLLNELSEPDQVLIDTEAELLRVHHINNATRRLGSANIQPPAVDASWKLVDIIRHRVMSGLFETSQSATSSTLGQGQLRPKTHLPKRLQSFDSKENEPMLFISQLEVVYAYEDDSNMRRRGYERVPVNFNLSGDVASWLWIRRSLPSHQTTHDGVELEWMKPITDIQIVQGCDEESESALRAHGYTKIAKSIDKRDRFIWYRRDDHERALRNITAVRLDEDSANLRTLALEKYGYKRMSALIEFKQRGFFSLSSMTISIALFVQKFETVETA